VATKLDLASGKKRKVSPADITALCNKYKGLEHFEVSFKGGENFRNMFNKIASNILDIQPVPERCCCFF
jgi:hypothetical protein